MLIGDLVKNFPSTVEILLDEGVNCVGCGAAYYETIEQGLIGHGRNDSEIDVVIKRLNGSIPNEIGDENLKITDNAVNRVKELLARKNRDSALRVIVERGGCAGQQYKFEFSEQKNSDDQVIEISGIKFFIDNESMDSLKGSKIDFVDSLTDAGFKVSNPNAKSTCGCGQSFR